jgi:uncharacterized protein
MSATFVPPDAELQALIKGTKTIAVVGISDDPSRPSNDVSQYMMRAGYQIVPVNPKLTELWGLKAYASLTEAAADGVDIDMVDVFRRAETVVPVAEEAVKVGAKSIWFQEGVVNEEAATLAKDAGLIVVMDRCVKKEHRRLGR